MRAPNRKRHLRRAVCDPPSDCDLGKLAREAIYVGSPEHKSYPSFAGPPKLRADASKCDPALTNPDEITAWLRKALRAGHVGAPWEGSFPRYAWYEAAGTVYEARLVNRQLGTYKGYPLLPSERPAGL